MDPKGKEEEILTETEILLSEEEEDINEGIKKIHRRLENLYSEE